MGCVIVELVINKPIFAGKSSNNQFLEIMKVLGTPTPEEIKAMNEKIKTKLPTIEAKSWKDYFKGKINDEQYIDLVSHLLVYDPKKRFTPYQTLNRPFFDDLKKKDAKIPKHLFEFKQCEINYDKENIQKLLSQIKK